AAAPPGCRARRSPCDPEPRRRIRPRDDQAAYAVCKDSLLPCAAMGAVGRAAIFRGVGQPLELKEYPVPEPGPGAAVVRITLANVCGSDLHTWRGDLDPAKRGRALPTHQGHEGTGRISALGEGVTTDSNGQPLAVGDR